LLVGLCGRSIDRLVECIWILACCDEYDGRERDDAMQQKEGIYVTCKFYSYIDGGAVAKKRVQMTSIRSCLAKVQANCVSVNKNRRQA